MILIIVYYHCVYKLWEALSPCQPIGSLGSLTPCEGPRGLRGKLCPNVLDFLNFLVSGDNRRIFASSLGLTGGGCLVLVKSGEDDVILSNEQLLVLVGSVELCLMNWLVGTL